MRNVRGLTIILLETTALHLGCCGRCAATGVLASACICATACILPIVYWKMKPSTLWIMDEKREGFNYPQGRRQEHKILSGLAPVKSDADVARVSGRNSHSAG